MAARERKYDVSKTIMWTQDDWINIKLAAAIKGVSEHRFVRNLTAKVAEKIVNDHNTKMRKWEKPDGDKETKK